MTPPWDLILGTLAGERLVKLEVVDPYAMGSEGACRAFARFLFELDAVAEGLGTVRLVAADGADLRHGLGDQRQQMRALHAAVRNAGVEHVRLDPLLRTAREERLHDRSVRAFFADGSRVVWDLGAGVEGFMERHRACTVTRTPE